MRTLSVELEADTIEALESERQLLGFEDRSSYVSWIVDNRSTIDDSEDRDRLSIYTDRIAELEAEVEKLEGPSAETGHSVSIPSFEDGSTSVEPDDGASASSSSNSEGQATLTADGGWPQTDAGPSTPASDPSTPAPDPSTPAAEPSTAADWSPSSEPAASAEIDDGFFAKNIEPERVDRVRDDSLTTDAGVLGAVAHDRVEELSRRAVAKTRKQVNRDVSTGLEFKSNTKLSRSDPTVPPGEELVDLSTIEVPGQSPDIVEQRRELVGRALAFLRDEGPLRKRDFVEGLYEEHPACYGSAGGWWRCLKAGLKQIEGVEGGDGIRIWRYTD